MKKYIAPTSKFINVASEGPLLTPSQIDPTPINPDEMDSNRRHSIWDEEY